jgi:hypothetical protein
MELLEIQSLLDGYKTTPTIEELRDISLKKLGI